MVKINRWPDVFNFRDFFGIYIIDGLRFFVWIFGLPQYCSEINNTGLCIHSIRIVKYSYVLFPQKNTVMSSISREIGTSERNNRGHERYRMK